MKLRTRYKYWKDNIKRMGIRIGSVRIVSHKRYYKLTNAGTAYTGIINDKDNQIKQLERDIISLKQLLDSSQQQVRRYK